jgi:hypothetical protein
MLRIDCDTCVARDTGACDDCLVTFLLDRPEGAIVFDVEEERALRLLEEGGLAPALRYRDGRPPPPATASA